MFAWAYAEAVSRARAAAAGHARREAVDSVRRDQLRRVVLANKAIASHAFHVAINARHDERAAARSEEDLRDLSIDILRALGLDMTDVTLRVRRVPVDVGRGRKAQLAIRAVPTIESARAALEKAGYADPLDGAGAAAGDGAITPDPPQR